ncbi:hypothetical protein GTP58_24525 [Duganella sp. CY15W]|uniref:hypothetical protein n=1 Tax=Duganella sp. CY15W TaxID=2692172 RepID=UPI00136D37E5|nr:hypothetical protein [Duganella sp. CY15W]MYM31504.1 hypothetical protein [Duganella sp. CY15W]
MGAFCVFGVSRAVSKQIAEKKTNEYEGRRALSITEWASRRDAMAAALFESCTKPYRISPELDSPQFCEDWIAVNPNEIKLAKVMVRGPKIDKGGGGRKTQRGRVHDLARVHGRQPVRGSAR